MSGETAYTLAFLLRYWLTLFGVIAAEGTNEEDDPLTEHEVYQLQGLLGLHYGLTNAEATNALHWPVLLPEAVRAQILEKYADAEELLGGKVPPRAPEPAVVDPDGEPVLTVAAAPADASVVVEVTHQLPPEGTPLVQAPESTSVTNDHTLSVESFPVEGAPVVTGDVNAPENTELTNEEVEQKLDAADVDLSDIEKDLDTLEDDADKAAVEEEESKKDE